MTRFPAGRRGPRSGEGVLEGKNRKETQSRVGRLSAVRIAAECHIGAWPRTPYGPSRGSEGGRREIFESYSSCTLPAVPPLVAAPPPFPLFRGHYGCWAFESICVYGGNAGKPPQPSARRAVKPENPENLQNPPANGRSILRTFLSQPFYTTCLRQQAITCGEAAPPLNPPASVTILYCGHRLFPVYYTKVTHG